MRHLPPLASLLALEAVLKTGSVTGAAQRLGRTHGAVSKQLHQLQDLAGIPLFARHGTGIALTADGERFAGAVGSGLDTIGAAWDRLTGKSGDRPVILAASATLAMRWVVPRLARFAQEFPGIEVQLTLAGPQDTPEMIGTPDLVISWDRMIEGSPPPPGSRVLGDSEIGFYAAPDYPVALRRSVAVFETRLLRRMSEAHWRDWPARKGLVFETAHDIAYAHTYLCIAAATSGLGAVITNRLLVESELEAGRLVAPLGTVVFKDGLIVMPGPDRSAGLPRAARTLMDWLAET